MTRTWKITVGRERPRWKVGDRVIVKLAPFRRVAGVVEAIRPNPDPPPKYLVVIDVRSAAEVFPDRVPPVPRVAGLEVVRARPEDRGREGRA